MPSRYGEVRWSSGTLPTDYTYTAQREEASMGLMDYRARYYDPALNRFIQADTIVPDPGSSQTLNRFTYTRGNPLKYNDPTGHDVGCPGGNMGTDCYGRPPDNVLSATETPEPTATATATSTSTATATSTSTPTATPSIIWFDDEFTITHYTFALESDPKYENDILVAPLGLGGDQYREGFIYGIEGVIMQGTGLAENGKHITINWWEHEGDLPDVGTDTIFTYGIGGKWGEPVSWETVATGDTRLPAGTRIVIEVYPGKVFTVNDTGEEVGANHIDIFVGGIILDEAKNLGYKTSRVGIIE